MQFTMCTQSSKITLETQLRKTDPSRSLIHLNKISTNQPTFKLTIHASPPRIIPHPPHPPPPSRDAPPTRDIRCWSRTEPCVVGVYPTVCGGAQCKVIQRNAKKKRENQKARRNRKPRYIYKTKKQRHIPASPPHPDQAH